MLWYIIYVIGSFIVFKLYNIFTLGMCKCRTKMIGKVVIVTGANSGIGFETAMDLARRGARVILACRDDIRGKDAQDKITATTGNTDVQYKHLDLASLASVRAFAEDILSTEKRLDVLINNAAATFLNQNRTADGLINEVQVNHFAPFLLTNLLLPALKASAPSRVINVSSLLYVFGSSNFKNLDRRIFSDIQVYFNTKLCNVLFTSELSRRLQGSGVVTNALHPGVARSNINRNANIFYRAFSNWYNNWFFKTEWEGAQTTIHLAVSPECGIITGQYFMDCKPARLQWMAKNPVKAKELWEISERAVNLKESEILFKN